MPRPRRPTRRRPTSKLRTIPYCQWRALRTIVSQYPPPTVYSVQRPLERGRGAHTTVGRVSKRRKAVSAASRQVVL